MTTEKLMSIKHINGEIIRSLTHIEAVRLWADPMDDPRLSTDKDGYGKFSSSWSLGYNIGVQDDLLGSLDNIFNLVEETNE